MISIMIESGEPWTSFRAYANTGLDPVHCSCGGAADVQSMGPRESPKIRNLVRFGCDVRWGAFLVHSHHKRGIRYVVRCSLSQHGSLNHVVLVRDSMQIFPIPSTPVKICLQHLSKSPTSIFIYYACLASALAQLSLDDWLT